MGNRCSWEEDANDSGMSCLVDASFPTKWLTTGHRDGTWSRTSTWTTSTTTHKCTKKETIRSIIRAFFLLFFSKISGKPQLGIDRYACFFRVVLYYLEEWFCNIFCSKKAKKILGLFFLSRVGTRILADSYFKSILMYCKKRVALLFPAKNNNVPVFFFRSKHGSQEGSGVLGRPPTALPRDGWLVGPEPRVPTPWCARRDLVSFSFIFFHLNPS